MPQLMLPGPNLHDKDAGPSTGPTDRQDGGRVAIVKLWEKLCDSPGLLGVDTVWFQSCLRRESVLQHFSTSSAELCSQLVVDHSSCL